MTASEHVSSIGHASVKDIPTQDWPESRRSRMRWIVTVVLLVALTSGGLLYWQKIRNADVTPPVAVRLVRPEVRDIDATVVATGTIRLRTGAEVRVGTQISGIVTKLNVTVGSHIRKGEVIAEIESRGLDARIAQAKSQIEVDEASLRKVEQDLARSHLLLDAQLIARQQTEDLEQDLKTSQARMEKSKSDLTVVESDLPYLTILAPITGTVASVSTQQGETVAASFNAPTFVTIIADNALELIAMIDETDIGNVRPSNPVVFTTETFPSRELRGVVDRIAPKATLISGVVNYETAIAIQTGTSVLKPDMTANVTVSTAHRHALMIPVEALHPKGEERFVYVARDGVAEMRKVSPGQRHGAFTEVNAGLSSTDVVFVGTPRSLPEGRP